jgi:hypothetical protein
VAAYRALWDAYVARGAWIGALSGFSVAQEGDIAACEAQRDLAVGAVNDLNEAARDLRGR